ncbi:magnesium and cobalt transport protein CorA [Methylopila henanensis]|uniref:Magnesium and cobalt transport protein CorA n=1 Tax=Methylopila henanensis TaxID=873516 RepID=A0ABW4K605_9HYPH
MTETEPDTPTPAGAEPGLVAAGVYAHGKRLSEIAVDEAGDWAARPGHVVWIGLKDPPEPLLRRVQRQFGLHELAIRQALREHPRPKLETYGDACFVTARTAQIVDGQLALGETHIIVGRGYVVSIRHGASSSYAPVRERCEASPAALTHGEDYILYALLDFIVSNYDGVLEKIRAQVERIEDHVLQGEQPPGRIERLYRLRRNLLRLRTAATPLLDVCRRLERSDVIAIDPDMAPRFRDVTGRIDRTRDDIDAMREVLAFAFEASMMLGQAQQTAIARQLASWAAILAAPTAIAGVYGMNFDHMPELHWRYGYFAVLGVIAAVCCGLYAYFRRKRWL